jgi:hypothetical protein
MTENTPSDDVYQGALAIHHQIVELYPRIAERSALFRGLQRSLRVYHYLLSMQPAWRRIGSFAHSPSGL